MLAEFEYVAPGTVPEAVATLATTIGSRPMSGGHGVLTAMKVRRQSPPLLVDLGGITTMRGVAELRIGALTTLAELAGHPGLADRYAAVSEAARATGDAQLRNRGTVGGSLASRWVAGDLSAALLTAGAALTITGVGGERVVAVADFYRPDGPALAAGDIITAVELPPLPVGIRSAYEKAADRATLEPVCGVAVGVSQSPDGALDTVRIAVTGATRHPARLVDAERALAGTRPPADISTLPVGPDDWYVDDTVTSAEYRTHLTRVLIGRALHRCLNLP
jgi:aerobic carbon-monoxide dehydrogenase medium subunit